MTEAIKIYHEFCDMDFRDYEETAADDLQTIKAIIETYGATEARQILKNYFE